MKKAVWMGLSALGLLAAMAMVGTINGPVEAMPTPEVHALGPKPLVPLDGPTPVNIKPRSQDVGAEVEALISEGSAAALLDAHRRVAACIRAGYVARRTGAAPYPNGCLELSARYGHSYMEWLDRAVAAGQVGAATAWLEAGPFGDLDSLETRASDPLVVAWKAQALALLERDAKAQDLQAVLSLYEQYRNGAITDVDIAKAFASLGVATELLAASDNRKMLNAATLELDRLRQQMDQDAMDQAARYLKVLKGR